MRALVVGLRRLGVDVRVEELGVASSLFALSFLLGTFQFAGKAVRQATFIDTWGAERLPYVYLLVALVAYPVLRLYEFLTQRVSRTLAMVTTNVAVVLGLAAFWWLYGRGDAWVPIAYYVWIAIATVLLLSQFWSYTNTRLDPRQARRLFGFVGAGGLLGGVAGGQLARFAGAGSPRFALIAAAVPIFLTVLLVPLLERRSTGKQRSMTGSTLAPGDPKDTPSGWTAVRESPHLQLIAVMMTITVVVAQTIDLQFNWVVETMTENLAERTALFGNLFSVMGLSAFVFQIVLTSRIHRRLGVGFAMRVLPTFVGLVSLLVLFSPLLPAVLAIFAVYSLKIGDNGLRYSLDHATRELLFVPVPARERVGAKAYIDVLVHRFAKGVAAVLLLTVTFGWFTPLEMSALSVLLCFVLYACTYRAQRQYVLALRDGLLAESAPGDTTERIDLNDVTTLELLVESLGSSEGGRVLQSIDLLAANDRHKLVSPLLLHHHDSSVRLRTLEVLAEGGVEDALPLVEMRLGDEEPEVRAEAVRAFATLSGRAGPQFMRRRLRDPDARVRSAAVNNLMLHGDDELKEEARAALEELMTDENTASRVEAANALGGIDEGALHLLLVQLLYDREPEVVRSAIGAVRRGAEGGVPSPLFVPILISLLRDRRLKHTARGALVAMGDGVIPALVHFMNDDNEQIWVRRGLPKTIAAFGSRAAFDALFEAFAGAQDLLLRSKIVEALSRAPEGYVSRKSVDRAFDDEGRRYCKALVRLVGLSSPDDYRLAGARWEWLPSSRSSLLQRFLDEQRLGHLRNCFRLLSIGGRQEDLGVALERLLSDNVKGRAKALEYLDNTLESGRRQRLMELIDDQPLPQRLQALERAYGLRPRGASDTLDELLVGHEIRDEAAQWLVAAAVQTVLEDSVTPLYARVRALAQSAADELVRETAEWAVEAL
ncbi:MAG: Npt1/Npt2 family nucleotide transporter [Acidobacteriota bacterium]